MGHYGEDGEYYPDYAETYMELFDTSVKVMMEHYPDQRLGQASFNVLHRERQAWADEIHGTPLDTFYLDDRLPAFRVWLSQKFENEYQQSGD